MIPASEEFATLVWSQLWQITLLIAAVALLARLFCRNKPHLAYLLWMLVVLKCLTPPLWSSPTGLFSWMQSEEVAQLAAIETATAEPSEPIDYEMFDESLLVAEESVSEAAVITTEPMSLPQILTRIWFLGVVLLGVVVALKWIYLHRKLKRATIPVDAELSSLVYCLKQKLGIRRRVQILVTTEPVGPAVFGFLRPVVVLPQSLLAEVSAEAIEPIVAHELVHVRRWDFASGLLQAVAQLVWWFHPLVWWANRQTSRERERCCDEEVVTGLGCLPTFYARSLLDVLELKRRLRSIFAFPGIRPVEITSKRMEDIMQRSDSFHRRTPRWCWGVLLLAATLVLPGAGFVFDAEQVSADQKPSSADGTTKKLDITKGGGWLYKLPPDGAWAQLKSEVTVDGQKAGRSNVVTMRCVGTVEIDGKKCRWIELENQITSRKTFRSSSGRDPLFSSNGGVNTFIWKLLFPEKPLLKGERPMDHLIAGWQKLNDGVPRQIPIPLPLRQTIWNAAFVHANFPGPLDDPKELKPEVVESKLGKLACRVVVGTREVSNPNVRVEYRTWLHQKAPFGVVAQTIKTEFKRDGQPAVKTIRTTKLVDFGTGAKSALPDKGYEPKKDKKDVSDAERKAVAALKDLGVSIFRNDDGEVVAFDFPLPPRSRRGLPGQLTDDDLVHVTKLNWSKTRSTHTTRSGMTLPQPRFLARYTKITDAGLVHLKELTQLRTVSLGSCRGITDAGLVHLKGLTKLEFLNLGGTNISDAGLVNLKGLTKLEFLGLSSTKISDAGLVHLKRLTSLKTLYLYSSQISNAGLGHLKGLDSLNRLELADTKISDAGLVHLKGLTSLKRLGLDSTDVSGAGLVHLKGLTDLDSLDLTDTDITDEGLVHLKGLTDLGGIDLTDTDIIDEGLVHLKGLTSLETLWLTGTDVSDAGLVHLKGLKKLKKVNLQNTKVTQDGVDKLKAALPKCKIEYP